MTVQLIVIVESWNRGMATTGDDVEASISPILDSSPSWQQNANRPIPIHRNMRPGEWLRGSLELEFYRTPLHLISLISKALSADVDCGIKGLDSRSNGVSLECS